VRVAVFLPNAQVAHVMAALEAHDEVRVADSWDCLESLIRLEPLSAVVFSPCADGTMDIARSCKLIRRFSSIPFVAYVPLDAPFARGIAHMSNDGLQDLVVVRANDSPARFREVLMRVSSIQELACVVDSLERWFSQLPGTLTQVLIDALRQPHRYPNAEAIAAAAGMTVSALYRSFRSARLTSPKSFVVGAHVFRGYLYLKDIGFSIRDVSAKLGYTHPRIFAHQIECVFGARPSRVRRSLDMDEAVERLVLWFSSRARSDGTDCMDGVPSLISKTTNSITTALMSLLIAVSPLIGSAQATIEAADFRRFADGRTWIVKQKVDHRVNVSADSIVIPPDFVTDRASIPSVFESIIQQNGPYQVAAERPSLLAANLRTLSLSKSKPYTPSILFPAKDITAGANHACALGTNGQAMCWGSNVTGQLGDGSNSNSQSLPQSVTGGLSFSVIRAGYGHSCAIRTNGSAYCWGANNFGQLGHGSGGTSRNPVAVAGGLKFDSLAVGANHNCARATNGFIYCWGNNSNGQLGDGTTVPFANMPRPIQGGFTMLQIAAGGTHSCNVVMGSGMFCWGSNGAGELGTGAGSGTALPSAVSIASDVIAIAVGNEHTCAIRAGGASGGPAYCWGRGTEEQLGDNDPSVANRPLPTLVKGGLVYKSISAGTSHTCALLHNGSAYCWGANVDWQLGDGTNNPQQPTPVPVVGGHFFKQISAGQRHTCAVETTGRIFCWGMNPKGQMGVPGLGGDPTPVQVQTTQLFNSVSVGAEFTCALDVAGVAYCWGGNSLGQLGDNTYVDKPSPHPIVSALRFTQLSSGKRHACGIAQGGSAYCWGSNLNGSLGNGNPALSYSPVPVSVSGGLTFSAISAGDDVTCGLTVDGHEYCWGSSSYGKIGDGTTTGDNHYSPVSIALGTLTWRSLGAGDSHTCAIVSTGPLYCWGRNNQNQLGTGIAGDRNVAGLVPAFSFAAVAGGAVHTCAIRADGVMMCWGDNSVGQLGDGTQNQRQTPTAVLGGIRFSRVSAGLGHTCGVRAPQIYCWGHNLAGKLGTGNSLASNRPIATLFFGNAQAIGVGWGHTCALDDVGTAYCWGDNQNGALGIGASNVGPSYLPILVRFP
jgi:alpha-tubulin suppressor-like RCC1 family protein/AraC-like DNA-binding protein